MTLRIATRRSALAIAQARAVADALGGAELVEMVTAGDRGERAAERDDKSRWVADLEQAVLDGEADLAVHSAKDVPGQLAEGLAIVAVPSRADPRDALCGAESVEALTSGARVGTSSLRRASQLRALRDDLTVVPMRGNVDTRLRRLGEGELDALVLALAGLRRLGREDDASAVLGADRFVPAPGQGALALEARVDDRDTRAAVTALDDGAASASLRAERALSSALGAGCRTPLGAHAAPLPGGGLRLSAYLGLPDGSAWLRDQVDGDLEEPEALGLAASERLLSCGGGELLAQAEALSPEPP